jgi:hypothetical protein
MPHRVTLVRSRSAREIDDFAFELAAAFHPEAVRMVTPFDVERYFDCELECRTGIEPVYLSLGEELEAYTDSAELKCIVSSELANYGQDVMQKRRLRATLAHEIGHCFLHVADSRRAHTMLRFLHDESASMQMFRQEDLHAYQNPEWQAWRFAGAFLMPEPCIRAAVNNQWSIQMMARGFDVNPAFVKARLNHLKIPNSVRGR